MGLVHPDQWLWLRGCFPRQTPSVTPPGTPPSHDPILHRIKLCPENLFFFVSHVTQFKDGWDQSWEVKFCSVISSKYFLRFHPLQHFLPTNYLIFFLDIVVVFFAFLLIFASRVCGPSSGHQGHQGPPPKRTPRILPHASPSLRGFPPSASPASPVFPRVPLWIRFPIPRSGIFSSLLRKIYRKRIIWRLQTKLIK